MKKFCPPPPHQIYMGGGGEVASLGKWQIVLVHNISIIQQQHSSTEMATEVVSSAHSEDTVDYLSISSYSVVQV